MVHVVDANRTGRGATVTERPGLAQFLRFCGVGGVGFAVDAVILMAAIHGLGFGPLPARLLSAAVAILTTFEFNRRWAFRAARREPYWPALGAYVGVQGFGLACNIAVYSTGLLLLPAPLNTPLPCLMAASGAALLVNYAGASRIVFRPRQDS